MCFGVINHLVKSDPWLELVCLEIAISNSRSTPCCRLKGRGSDYHAQWIEQSLGDIAVDVCELGSGQVLVVDLCAGRELCLFSQMLRSGYGEQAVNIIRHSGFGV